MNRSAETAESASKRVQLSDGIARLFKIERWCVENATWVALGFIAIAFCISVYCANACYLNGDEAQHFNAARPPSWLGAYQGSLGLAHPPLFILVLHGVLFLGRKELILRLPSIIGATLALWFLFAWLRRCIGDFPALVGLGITALSPATLSVATEVRQYALLLFFICAALYSGERAFTQGSVQWAVLEWFFLIGAVLTHYTAVLAAFSVGLYCWTRAVLDHIPRRLAITIGSCQVIFSAVVCWLYFAHVRRTIPFGLGSSVGHLSMDYLQVYYKGTQESWLGYVWRAIYWTFAYLSGRSRVPFPILFLIIFAIGIIVLLRSSTKASPLLALLVISPFAAGLAAGALKIFPFAGSRHETYLVPFYAAGLAAAFGWTPRKVAIPLLFLAALIAPFWIWHLKLANDWRTMPKDDMSRAIASIYRSVPLGAPVVVDDGTRFVLGYYLTQNDTALDSVESRHGTSIQLGGFSIVVPSGFEWTFSSRDVLVRASEAARMAQVKLGVPFWIVSIAVNPPALGSQLEPRTNCDAEEFGLITEMKCRP